MNFKILSSLAGVTNERKDARLIGTHNGFFHNDETVACAIFCLMYSNESVEILRTQDSEMLAQCDICVDIGGGEFDHHQAGFNKCRENGIKYASAGLVWARYGESLIELIGKKYFPGTVYNIANVFKLLDDTVIVPVDCEDNGEEEKPHGFSFISSFIPLWFENNQETFNKQFQEALIVTMTVLEQKLKTAIGSEIFKDIVKSNWNNKEYFKDGILEIPAQTELWKEPVMNLNVSGEGEEINFVIFPYPDGGWAAQCVPPSLEDKFGKRIPFPAEWAGQTDKLSKIAKVEGAIRCHNGCFFIRAMTKEAVIQMCKIATRCYTRIDR